MKKLFQPSISPEMEYATQQPRVKNKRLTFLLEADQSAATIRNNSL